ncbi:hypothetical protein BKG82_26175 [Mycobacteroides chelonae]|uniref:Transcriptional regulator n=1 Tax=Mycobacteroides chelonae TaxID=1774 RepID=A0A1S1LHG8_MYCCH|nr:hypothetical protein [Mycobacteroides chelonae]OHU47147.1 hypothetical protein BKG82_26175 [Mycobacteroides chelonae]
MSSAQQDLILDRHVVIAAPTGTFLPSGKRLLGPVSSVDNIRDLIVWAHRPNQRLLQPIPSADKEPVPAQLHIIGSTVSTVIGDLAENAAASEITQQAAVALAPLIGVGWELRPAGPMSFDLVRSELGVPLVVRVILEPVPWLALSEDGYIDPEDLGARFMQWARLFHLAPAASAAASAAAIQQRIMGARQARTEGGAVVTEPGLLPEQIVPELAVQPAWAPDPAYVQDVLDTADALVWLEQECPQLASAGMLSFGHGVPERLSGIEAVAAAGASPRRFGYWHVTLPSGESLSLPAGVPLPHPHMRALEPVQTWVNTEDLVMLCCAVRDGGAGASIDQLKVDAALVWPEQGRILEAWKKQVHSARKQLVDDPHMQALVDSSAAAYIEAFADPEAWTLPDDQVNVQPAWAAAESTHIRHRSRKAMMRISREHRIWPLYVNGAGMLYALRGGEDAVSARDLADTHSDKLGRLLVMRELPITDEMILAVVQSESAQVLAEVFSEALGISNSLAVGQGVSIPAEVPTTEAVEDITGVELSQGDPAANEAVVESPQPAVAKEEVQPAIDPPAAAESVPEKKPAKTTKKTGSGKVGPPAGPRTPAAVLHTDGLWFPDGTHIELRDPIVHIGQIAELIFTHDLGYQLTERYAEPGQIWVTEDACRGFGIDVDAFDKAKRSQSVRRVTEGIDFATLAVAQGWRFGKGGGTDDESVPRLSTWNRVYYEGDDDRWQGRTAVWVALIPGMVFAYTKNATEDMPVLTGNPEPVALARRLKKFADALGFPWKLSAGVTSMDLTKQTVASTWDKEQREKAFAPSTTPAPVGITDIEYDISWSRPPTEEEAKRKYTHAYDRGGSYAAAAGAVEMPIGEPVHYTDGYPGGSDAFDPRIPGYLLLGEVPEQADLRYPHPLNPRRPTGHRFTEPKWVCTPVLEIARALGYNPPILEAILWHEHTRLLRGWAAAFSHASQVLDTEDPDDQAARNQVKVTRTHGMGLMDSEVHMGGKEGFHPARRLMTVSKTNANIIRMIIKIGEATGEWPVAVDHDTIIYLSDEPDPDKAWPGPAESYGRKFGQYKPERHGLLADHLQYLNGKTYRGRLFLKKTDQWREMLPELLNEENGGNE